jgi:hypothetical protein
MALTQEQHFSARVEEFKTLGAHIESTTAEINALERWTVIGVAAVWSWLLVNPIDASSRIIQIIAWSIPVFLVAAAWARKFALARRLHLLYQYKWSELEPALGLGWERWYEDKGRSYRREIATAYWTGLFALTILGAIWHRRS